MEQAARVAGIADTVDLTADPAKDVELGHHYSRSRNISRASIPIAHQRSFSVVTHDASSITGGINGGVSRRPSMSAYDVQQPDPSATSQLQTFQDDDDDPLPWDSQHPCFPHKNPHIPLASPLYISTRIIRIKRDWMIAGDLAPAFSAVYPEILEPFLPEQAFRPLIAHINQALIAAFDPRTMRNAVDAILGLLTGWLWDDFGFARIKHTLRDLEAYTEAWNREVGASTGVEVIPLRRTGYLSLDIQIPDPQLGTDDGAVSVANTSRPVSVRSGQIPRLNYSNSGVGGFDLEDMDSRPDVPPIPPAYLEQAAQKLGREELEANGSVMAR